MLSDRLREQLEEIRSRPIRSEEEAGTVEEATRIVAEAVRLEERARRLMARASGESLGKGSGGPEEPPEAGRGPLFGLSLHEAAARVLAEAGTPLHARELGARIKAGGWRHPRSERARPDQIVFQLAARLPRYPTRFRRVAPNTFALAEWGDRAGGAGWRPRLGVFSGGGKPTSRQIEDPTEPAAGGPWRSS